MVDTQQLLAWPVGFSLNTVDLPEIDDSSHSLDMKHLATLDYASISSSSVPSSMSPSLVSSISSVGMAYDPSPPQTDEHLTNMDYTNVHSYRMELNVHSKSSLYDGLTEVTSCRGRFVCVLKASEVSFNQPGKGCKTWSKKCLSFCLYWWTCPFDFPSSWFNQTGTRVTSAVFWQSSLLKAPGRCVVDIAEHRVSCVWGQSLGVSLWRACVWGV